MDIDVSRLDGTELVLAGPAPLPVEDIEPGALGADGIELPEAFQATVRARRTGQEVRIRGEASGTVRLQCSRCLTWSPKAMHVTLDARFRLATAASGRQGKPRAGAVDLEAETSEDDDSERDGSVLPPGTRSIRVGPLVREQVLLDLPLRPLCREDCRGLCARCGADLNQGACPCPPDAATPDPRLGALAGLRKKLQQS